jgi:aquaporin Z
MVTAVVISHSKIRRREEGRVDTRIRSLVAEFIGTFGLVFFGAGSICADFVLRGGQAPFAAADLLLVAGTHAVVLGVLVTALGHISGAHFNPAVTVAAAIGRHIEPALAAMYIVTQLVAGTAAAILLRVFFSAAVLAGVKYGSPFPASDISAGQAFIVEVVLTFFLVTVVYATAIDPLGAFGKIAGFAIGLVLFFDIAVGGPLTGAAMNPARAFGPALLAGILDGTHFLAYWLGPLIGGALAAFLYEAVLTHEQPESGGPPT